MKKKHVECVSLKETFFSRASQLFEIWAMYHLNLLENDESIGIDRLYIGSFTSKDVTDWKREAKRLKELTRKRQREQIEEELRESREKKRLQKAREKVEQERDQGTMEVEGAQPSDAQFQDANVDLNNVMEEQVGNEPKQVVPVIKDNTVQFSPSKFLNVNLVTYFE